MSTTAPTASPSFDPTLDFVPLFPDQTEDVILARLIDWANEGLDPVADADAWTDTREGSHWRTPIMPCVREFARLYDLAGSEVPMSGFVLWAWETYLDDLAAVYEVYRLPGTPSTGVETFTGPDGTIISPGATVSAVPSTPSDPAMEYEVTVGGTIGVGGTIDLPVQATEVGEAGDVGAGAVSAPSSPLPGVVLLSNAEPMIGGTDPETDDALRTRVLAAIAGKGPGAVADYVRWAGGWPGVGLVTVVAVWDGASTVLVMIADPNGQPLPDAVVAALQADLDPVPGQGAGTAPVGAIVTVNTSTLLNVAVAAALEFETGYSWDGSGGTTAVGPSIESQIVTYFLSIAPGGEVVLAHVAGIIATWPGMHDVSGVTLNGAAVNIAVGLMPPQVPVLESFTPS